MFRPKLPNRSPEPLLHLWFHLITAVNLQCAEFVSRGCEIFEEGYQGLPIIVVPDVQSEVLETREDPVPVKNRLREGDVKRCLIKVHCP